MSDASKNAKPGNTANTVLLGMLILICSCALIIAVRLHDRLSSLVDQLQLLNEGRQPTPGTTPVAVKSKDGEGSAQPAATLPLVARTRSPLPQPGEEIIKPLPATQLVTGTPEVPKATSPPPGPGVVVFWTKAHEHVGQDITVEGKIVATNNIGNYCFLNFTKEPRGGDKFYLVIYKEAFAEFGGNPEDMLKDKLLRVTGKVEMDPKGDRPQIRIKGKEQVVVVE